MVLGLKEQDQLLFVKLASKQVHVSDTGVRWGVW